MIQPHPYEKDQSEYTNFINIERGINNLYHVSNA